MTISHMDEKKIKHLEMIQGVVNRMSHISFLLKGWSVVLVSALFALSAKDSNVQFVLLAYFPALIFWFLDGYFLWQERLYRRLYDRARLVDESEVDFSMSTQEVRCATSLWTEVVFSKTLVVFHGVICFTILIVMLFSL